jgi:hypothetical protein
MRAYRGAIQVTTRSRSGEHLAVAIFSAALGLVGCHAPVDPAVDDLARLAPISSIDSASAGGTTTAEAPLACSVASDRRPAIGVADESSELAAPPRNLPTRRPRDRDQLVTITFDDLRVNMKEDQRFEPSMATDRVRELDGQRIRIRGFLFPAIFQQTGIDKFPLVMNTECKFGPGGLAHHVILVEMVDGATTSYTMRPIAVTGRLTLAPWNGPDANTWALYHIAGERVD